jgi:hypothetical protein
MLMTNLLASTADEYCCGMLKSIVVLGLFGMLSLVVLTIINLRAVAKDVAAFLQEEETDRQWPSEPKPPNAPEVNS